MQFKTTFLWSVLLLSVSFNSKSQVVYQRAIGSAGTDNAESITTSTEGRLISFGNTTELGTADWMLVKTDEAGELVWSKALGGNSAEFGQQIRTTTDGGFIMTGWTTSYGAGDDDVMLIKTDDTGTVEWAKAYGRNSIDRGRSVIQTSDGGYMVLGHTSGFGLSVNDLYLIKTDAVGDTAWVKIYGGINATNENGWSIEETSDGGYITTGNTAEGPGFLNMLLVKFDSQGDTLWTKSFGGADAQSSGLSVIEDDNGDYIATGWTNAFGAGGKDLYVVKTSSDGELIWSRTFGGMEDEEAQEIILNDDSYVLVGPSETFESFPFSGPDVYVVHLDLDGNVISEFAVGNMNMDHMSGVVGGENGISMVGWMENNASKSNDIYLVHATNSLQTCESFDLSTKNTGPQTEVTAAPISQSFIDTPTEVSTISLDVDQEIVFAEQSLCEDVISSVDEIDLEEAWSIFPNPSNGQFQYISAYPVERLEIYNVLGEKLQKVDWNQQKNTVMINEGRGVYLVKVSTSLGISTRRLVVH